MFSHITERNTLKNDGKVWKVKYTGLIVLASLYNCRFTLWMFFVFCFKFIYFSWRLITLQYGSGFCHTAFFSNLYLLEVFLLSETNSLIFN